jgi:hypothetical protein
MNVISAINNIDNNRWAIDNLGDWPENLQIGFTSANPTTIFDNLKFGFCLTQGKTTIKEKNFPDGPYQYERSTQLYIVSENLNLLPNKIYNLAVWSENAGIRSEFNFSFKTAIPKQPYNSWAWTGEFWIPPIPKPDEENHYDWDESTQQWIIFAGE